MSSGGRDSAPPEASTTCALLCSSAKLRKKCIHSTYAKGGQEREGGRGGGGYVALYDDSTKQVLRAVVKGRENSDEDDVVRIEEAVPSSSIGNGECACVSVSSLGSVAYILNRRVFVDGRELTRAEEMAPTAHTQDIAWDDDGNLLAAISCWPQGSRTAVEIVLYEALDRRHDSLDVDTKSLCRLNPLPLSWAVHFTALPSASGASSVKSVAWSGNECIVVATETDIIAWRLCRRDNDKVRLSSSVLLLGEHIQPRCICALPSMLVVTVDREILSTAEPTFRGDDNETKTTLLGKEDDNQGDVPFLRASGIPDLATSFLGNDNIATQVSELRHAFLCCVNLRSRKPADHICGEKGRIELQDVIVVDILTVMDSMIAAGSSVQDSLYIFEVRGKSDDEREIVPLQKLQITAQGPRQSCFTTLSATFFERMGGRMIICIVQGERSNSSPFGSFSSCQTQKVSVLQKSLPFVRAGLPPVSKTHHEVDATNPADVIQRLNRRVEKLEESSKRQEDLLVRLATHLGLNSSD